MDLKTFLLVAVLVSSATAGPTGSRTLECASKCDQNNKFFYELGRKYEYAYEVETRTTVGNDDDNNDATIRVSALATVQPVSPCEYLLSLSEVTLHGSEQSETFATEVTKRPLRFAFHDGKIEHVCPTQEETPWVVNFKKGILSNLQNSIPSFDEGTKAIVTEQDISGVCETTYTSQKTEDDSIIIERRKTPSDCSRSPQIRQKLSSLGFSFDSLVQGLPVIKSQQFCSQTISDDIIQSVTCMEDHTFKPFEHRAPGANTHTETKMMLKNIKTSTSPLLESFTTRDELLFENPDLEMEDSAMEEAEALLAKLEFLTENGIKKEVPALFSELVGSLRSFSYYQLRKLVDSNRSRIKNFVADALPLVGTPASTEAFVDLILRGEVSEEDRDVWISSLAFTKNPSLQMFSAIEPLVRDVNENKALLGISSMIHNYCLNNNNCKEKQIIKTLIRNFESRLGISCRVTSEEEKLNILYALKAIGNAGQFVNAEYILERCYLEDNPMEIRVAAIDAWRRVPCNDENIERSHFLASFSDQTQDNEIRIASYLALMKCPTQELVNTLKNSLTSEGVNHVASFVWTHLTNLQESAAPEKQWIRHLIGEELLQNKFKPESLKLSRNFESSFFLKEQEFGASVENNLIFSGKSFLPRSTMLNFTIDLFGESINLFEVGGRIEGLESYIEKFFGPDGYYPEETIEAIVKNLRQKDSEDKTNLENYLPKEEDEPKGSYYMKLFGNELFYRNFKGIENALPEMTFSNIFDVIMELSQKGSVDYTKSYNLIDSDFTFPTIAGLPVKLALNGNAVIGFKLNGEFNFEDLSSFNIEGTVHPSAAVTVDASMAVDAFVTMSGVKMVSTMHSSTSVSGKATVNKGKLVDLTINTPEDKTEIFDMKKEFFTINNGVVKKQELRNYSIGRCFSTGGLGMDICTKYIPSESYTSQITLVKTDSHSGYVFHYSNDKDKISLLLDMPGSQTDKKWSASLIRKPGHYEFDLHFVVVINAKLAYVFSDQKTSLDVALTLNNFETLATKFNIDHVMEGNLFKHANGEVLLTYHIQDEEIYNFNAGFKYEPTKTFDARVEWKVANEPEFLANFNLNRKSEDNSLSLNFMSPPFELKLSGSVGKFLGENSAILKGSYRLFKNPLKSFTTHLQYQNQVNNDGMISSASVDIEDLDFKTDVNFKIKDTDFIGRIVGKFSKITWDIEHNQSYQETTKGVEMKIYHRSSIPILLWDALGIHQFVLSKEQVTSDTEVQFRNRDIFKEQFAWNYGKDIFVEQTFNFNDSQRLYQKYFVEKKTPTSWTWEHHIKINDFVDNQFDGSFEYATSNNEISAKLNIINNHKSDDKTNVGDFEWIVNANESKLHSETTLNFNKEKSFLIASASRSHLKIDSNFIKPFTAEAKIENGDGEKNFFLTSNLDDTVFLLSGGFGPHNLHGTFKYKEQEIKFLARLQTGSMELEAQLSPQKRFALWGHYNPGSYDLGFETPFKGWEKQKATLDYTSTKNGSFQGQARITFATTNLMALTFDFKTEFDYPVRSYSFNSRFTSTLKKIEKIELSFKHYLSRKTMNTKVEGRWNSEVLKGNLDLTKNDDSTISLEASLKTPFTKDISISSEFKLLWVEIASSFDIAYGSQKTRLLLKIDLSNSEVVKGNFICSSPILPEITLNLSLKLTKIAKTIEINGKYNNEKILMLGTCEKIRTDEKDICKLSLKLITGSITVFSGSYAHEVGPKFDFKTDIKISSDLVSDQSVKGHIEGKFSLPSSADVTGYIFGPGNLSGRLEINHKITNGKILTEINIEQNNSKIGITLGGSIDTENKVGSIQGETKSTWPLMDGFKIIVEHKLQNEARETDIVIIKKDFNFKLFHSLIMKNAFNWTNILKFNDVFNLRSENTLSEKIMKHITKVTWAEKAIELRFEGRSSQKQYNLVTMIDTPWTSVIQITAEHKSEGPKRKTEMQIEYGNEKYLLIETEYEFGEKSKFATISISNKDWNLEPLLFEMQWISGVNNELNLKSRLNQLFVVDLQLFNKEDTCGVNISIKINKEDHPISVIANYLQSSNENKIYIEYNGREKYAVDLRVGIQYRSGKISAILTIPYFFEKTFTNTISLDYRDHPLHVILESDFNDQRYYLETLLESNRFSLKTESPSSKGSLKMKWQLSDTEKSLNLDFKSPFTSVMDASLFMNAKIEQTTTFKFESKYGNNEINLTGEISNTLFDLKSNTTIRGWENFEAKAEFAHAEISGMISKNSQVMTFSGEGNFETSKGEGQLHFSFPSSEYKENDIVVEYTNNKGIKKVEIDANIGSKAWKFHVLSEPTEVSSIKVTMDIETPLEFFQKTTLDVTIKQSSIKVNGEVNEFKFDYSTIITFKDLRKGKVTVNFVSNIPQWTSFFIECDIDASKTPYKAFLEVRCEKSVQNYSLFLDISRDNIEMELITPIKSLENIKVNGNYKFHDNEFDFSFHFTSDFTNFNMFGHCDLTDFIPDIKFNSSFPNSEYKDIELVIKGMKNSIYFLLKLGSDTYKVNLFSNIRNLEGEASVAVDLYELVDLKIDISFDLVREYKQFDITMQRDRILKGVSIQGKLSSNEINFRIKTPIEYFRLIVINGKFEKLGDIYIMSGKIINNDDMFEFEGKAIETENGMEIQGKFPIDYYTTQIIHATITREKTSLKFIRGGEEKEILISYLDDNTNAFIKINTPFDQLSYLAIGARREITSHGANVNIYIHKDSERIELNGSLDVQLPLKFNLKTDVNAPSSFGEFSFQLFYDFVSMEKNIGLIMGNNQKLWKYVVETLFKGPEHGYFKVHTPMLGYEISGFEYKFKTTNIKDTEAFISIIKNAEEFTFGIQSKYNTNELALMLQTPFENYESFGIESKLSLENKQGKLKLNFGSYKLLIDGSLQLDDFIIHIETSAENFKILKLSSKYKWESLKKSVLFEFVFNECKYEVNGRIITSQRSPQISFKFISPFEFLSKFEITGKLDFESPLELFEVGLKFNSLKYCLFFGYELDTLRGSIKLHIVTPVRNWTSSNLSAIIDLSRDTKSLNISIERENISKTISLSGKVMDGEIDFDLQTPTGMASNFRCGGAISRSKRSIGFEMMNDHHTAGLYASFKSLKITAKTPFEKVRDIDFELSRSRGGWSLSYKRNNNQVYMNISAEKKARGFDIKINSEIPGWELLAISGRLDAGEILGYIRGQINSHIVHISGSGTFGPKTGSLTITSTSSYEKYKRVVTTIEYHSKRKIFNFESKSDSSDFHISIKLQRGLIVDVFVPHEQQNTIIKGNLNAFNGLLEAKSRFSFLQTFSIKYGLQHLPMGASAFFTIEYNGLKVVEYESKIEEDLRHFMLHLRRGENHTMIHLHSEGMAKLEFIFERNHKQFKVSMTGNGNLPTIGKIDYTIFNSFRQVPRTVSGTIDIDRTSSPKKITLEVRWHNGHHYTFYLTYNASLYDLKRGDFTLRSVTPTREMAPWKDISGEWTFQRGNLRAVIRAGPLEYNLTGKIGLLETDLVIDSNAFPVKLFAQWKLIRMGKKRDYSVKIGSEERYVMIKFMGTMEYNEFDGGDISGAFRASRFMPHDFNFTATWKKDGNILRGNGTYEYGEFRGTHNLKHFERIPDQRAVTLKWEATTSKGTIVIDGKYNLKQRMIDFLITRGNAELLLIKLSLDNVSGSFSENTIHFAIPFIGKGQVTLSHDFRNPLAKSVKAIGQINSKEISYIFNWTRDRKLTTFDLKGEINSVLFGVAHVEANFDVRNFNNAKGGLIYQRNDNKHIKLEWSRVKTATNLADKLEFDSHFESLPKARIYLNADWSKGFEIDAGLHWNDKAIKANLNITSKNTVATITTPFPNFGNINIDIRYNLKKAKSKTVTFRYSRGENIIEMDFQLKVPNKKSGSLTLSLVSPFEVLKTLNFDASWKKGVFQAVYKRNDVTVNFDGTAEVKAGKSSFNLKFVPPSGNPVEIVFSYDLESFVKGTGKKVKDLINVKLQIAQQHVDFSVKGYRTKDHVFIEVNGGSSFEVMRQFYLKLDSELNLNKRQGQLNVKVDDFVFNMRNTYEKRPNGFYARSQMDSTLTKLPGLIVGFGLERGSYIVTIGYGEDREITLTMKGKDNFRKGFTGTIDLPARGIHGLEYSLNYNFKSEDKLKVNLNIKIDEGRSIEAEILYNSSGVRTRLSSPWTGDHSARVRRSISNGHFMTDVGIDNCGITIEGEYDKYSLKKGFKIEGEFFGQKILVAGFSNIKSLADSHGKLIIQTPFYPLRNLGGEFKIKATNGKFIGNLDVNVLYCISAKAEIDYDRKLVGDININFENLIYEITCDFKHDTEKRALDGTINIKTPHPSFERILIESTITTMNSKMFEANFAIDHPTYPFSFDVMVKLDAPVISMDITAKSPNNNEFRIVADYSLIKYPFCLKGNSSVYSNSQLIFNSNAELSYKALNDMHINYKVNCGQNYLKGSVNLEIIKERIEGTLKVVFMDYHTFEIITNIPTNLKKVLFEVSYSGNEEKHTLLLNMVKGTTSRKYFFGIDSPLLLKGSLDLTMYEEPSPTIKAMIQAPQGQVKFNIFLEGRRRNISKSRLVSEIEINSFYFTNGLNIYAEYQETFTASDIKIKVDGEHHYIFYGKLEHINRLVNLQINVEAPFLKAEKGSIYISYDRNENFKLTIQSFIFDYINNLYIDVKNDAIIFNCVSPSIPTGMVRVEGKLVVHSPPDLDFKVMFAEGSGQHTWSAEGNVNLISSKTSKSVDLKIRTPYEDYEKLEFGFSYTEGDITRLLAFAKPFNLDGEFFYGVDASVLNAGLEIRTGNERFSHTQAEAIIPLNEFAPEFTAYFREVEYKAMAKVITTEDGGELSFDFKNIIPQLLSQTTEISYRSKVPYEFDIQFEKLKFGIIFDSSFLVPFQAIDTNDYYMQYWPVTMLTMHVFF